MAIQTVGATKAVAQPVSETRGAEKLRLLYIDNLRILLITMVIVIHMAVTC